MQMRQETDYVLHHAQEIIAIFPAMRDFTDLLVRGILRQANAGGRSTRYKLNDSSTRAKRRALPWTTV